MLCINDHNTDPCFNLAAEEYVLKNFAEDCFMLWRNAPSVIVGRHQNTLAEINVDYVKRNNIKVVRRLSGGGAVFHDLGNLNFTFIETARDGRLVNFQKYTRPILAVLQSLGIDARFEGRNDLVIGGKKFSGNAEHVHRSRVLHHGTLLFASELADLSGALNAHPEKFTGKAIKSVPNRVTNISSHLKEPLDIEQFRDMVLSYIMANWNTGHGTRHGERDTGSTESTGFTGSGLCFCCAQQKQSPDPALYPYTETDIAAINKLRDEKYATWDWNFGRSPGYNMVNTLRTAGGRLEAHLDVQNGIIQRARLLGDFFNIADIAALEHLLAGTPHTETHIRRKLEQEQVKISDYLVNITEDELVEAVSLAGAKASAKDANSIRRVGI